MAGSYQVSCAPNTKPVLAGPTKPGGRRVTILNAHATEPLYIGGNDNEPDRAPLTASTGFRVPAAGTFTTIVDGDEILYGLTGTSTVTINVHVFRTNAAG